MWKKEEKKNPPFTFNITQINQYLFCLTSSIFSCSSTLLLIQESKRKRSIFATCDMHSYSYIFLY
jgi:hypothetical protein